MNDFILRRVPICGCFYLFKIHFGGVRLFLPVLSIRLTNDCAVTRHESLIFITVIEDVAARGVQLHF